MSSLSDLLIIAICCIVALVWFGVATHGTYFVPLRIRTAFASLFDRSAGDRSSRANGGGQ